MINIGRQIASDLWSTNNPNHTISCKAWIPWYLWYDSRMQPGDFRALLFSNHIYALINATKHELKAIWHELR